jgi:hypothetical protein
MLPVPVEGLIQYCKGFDKLNQTVFTLLRLPLVLNMKIQLSKIILLLLLLASCKRVPETFLGYPLVYSTEYLDDPALPFALQQIKCKGLSNDKIEISLTIRNTLSSRISISMTAWELETSHGLRSAIENLTGENIHLSGNDQKEIVLIFHPINKLQLYRLTGLHGSLLQSYSLNYESKVVAHFKLSDAMHASYLKHQIQPTPYSLSISANFIQKQETHMHTITSPQLSVKVSEQEILIGGLNTIMSVYHHADTLNVQIRLINHSNFPVSVHTNYIAVQTNDKAISPISFPNDSLLIPKSQRVQIDLKYPLLISPPDSLIIDVSSLTFVTPEIIPVMVTGKLIFKQRPLQENQ